MPLFYRKGNRLREAETCPRSYLARSRGGTRMASGQRHQRAIAASVAESVMIKSMFDSLNWALILPLIVTE